MNVIRDITSSVTNNHINYYYSFEQIIEFIKDGYSVNIYNDIDVYKYIKELSKYCNINGKGLRHPSSMSTSTNVFHSFLLRDRFTVRDVHTWVLSDIYIDNKKNYNVNMFESSTNFVNRGEFIINCYSMD